MEEKKISELDRSLIDLMEERKKVAAAEAQLAELKYKNTILQIYLKYNLSLSDTIDAQGKVISQNEEVKA